MIRPLSIAAAALLLGSAVSVSSDALAQVNPGNLKWGPAPPALPRGAQVAVLSGNPAQAGLFTIRLRFPPGYTVPPHSHPRDEYVTVVSGQLALGMGSRLNRARAARLVAGGFAHAPARMNHYAFTGTGAVTQITGQGPLVVNYVNPADDPRHRR